MSQTVIGQALKNASKPTPVTLLNAKWAKIGVLLPSNEVKPLGLMQGVTVNVGYITERIVEIGETYTVPISGAKVVTMTARRLLLTKEGLLKQFAIQDVDPFDLVSASKEDRLGAGLVIEFHVESQINPMNSEYHSQRFIVPYALVSSWSANYDSGSILVFEDVTIEGSEFTQEIPNEKGPEFPPGDYPINYPILV